MASFRVALPVVATAGHIAASGVLRCTVIVTVSIGSVSMRALVRCPVGLPAPVSMCQTFSVLAAFGRIVCPVSTARTPWIGPSTGTPSAAALRASLRARAWLHNAASMVSLSARASFARVSSQCRAVGPAWMSPMCPRRVRTVAAMGIAAIMAFQRPQSARSTSWADLVDAAAMPAPHIVPGELELMPDYVRTRRGADWIDNEAPPVEQGGMTVTDTISRASLARAVALTRGMEAQIDHQFGRVLAKLDTLGLTDQTVVIFTSDHGEFLGNHGPLHKGPPPYGDLCRVRFVMAGPGVPREARTMAPSSHLDLMPTLLELEGVDGEGATLDGQSLVPELRGRDPERHVRFLEFHPRIDRRVYNHSMVTDRWRLTLYPEGERAGASCSISKRTRASTRICSTIPLTIACVSDWPDAWNRTFGLGPTRERR